MPVTTCFNPRPALAGRASGDKIVGDVHAEVSILARPSRAGRPGPGYRTKYPDIVSILARPSRAGRPGGGARAGCRRSVSILARPSRAGRQVSRIALSHQSKFRTLRAPSSASPIRGAADSPTSEFGMQNQTVTCAANRPAIPRHSRSARHRTSGPSKSAALNLPYSRTCSSTGSVRR